jgi:hypothetical protein
MITVICNSKFEPLLISLGARIIGGKWTVTTIPDITREMLESEGATIEGCKYRCWGLWFPNLYWVTRDTRCTVAFNTLAKRARGQVDLDSFVVGRAKPCRMKKRKGTGEGYLVKHQDKIYSSEAALARDFGVDPVLYKSRRQLGWSIEEALG